MPETFGVSREWSLYRSTTHFSGERPHILYSCALEGMSKIKALLNCNLFLLPPGNLIPSGVVSEETDSSMPVKTDRPLSPTRLSLASADKLERLWIGADISAIAVEHVQERLKEKRHKKVKRDYVMKECR